MENQAAAGSIMDGEDRISELPQHILQNHILSLLPQDVAVRTCVLSKSWRHLGPTRPKIEFHERDFPESEEKFLSVVENTLQRYDDQKLSVQEFVLSMLDLSPTSISNSLLNKWNVKLHMLKRLSLEHVCIEDETFEKIISSCPSIEHLVLDCCVELTSVKVHKARNLKHLACDFLYDNCSIEININDAPSLETIRIGECRNWWHNNKNYFLPRLKSVSLFEVHLPTELLNNPWLSKNCPCLEELELHSCSGFTELNLSNRSIKRLIIKFPKYPLTKVAIDAANMLYFEFTSNHLPSNVSFATTSGEWKSCIEVWLSSSTWSLKKLHEFLKALRQSQISLVIPSRFLPLKNRNTFSCEHVVVEHLCLSEQYSSSEVPDLLNFMFRICRPRYIGLSKVHLQLAESIWKTLVSKGKMRKCHFWKQELEESSIQVSEQKTKEWHSFQQNILFRLKWRDLS